MIVDNLKMSRTTFALGSKGCAVRLAFPVATFPMGIARSTTYERELIGFQSMACGGGCRKKRSFETPETRLAKPSFGMSVFAVISKSVVSFRPMLVRLSGADGDKGFDDAVWTDLPPDFLGKPFSVKAAVAYVEGLDA